LTTHVEMKIGTQVLSADYKDFQDYGVMFPSRIVQKVDGRVVAGPDGHRGDGQSLFDLSTAKGTLAEIAWPWGASPQNQNGTTIWTRDLQYC
jgi:hypothetical protein